MGNNLESTENRLQRLNLVLKTIRSIHQLLILERDRPRLLQGICDHLVRNQGYYNVWIAMLNESGEIRHIISAGFEEEICPEFESLISEGRLNCIRDSLKFKRTVIFGNPSEDCTDCPLSVSYSNRGAVALPLQFEDRTFGVMTVSFSQRFIQDNEELTLLKDLSNEIAFALHNKEQEELRRRAERTLRESEERYRSVFENTGSATIIVEKDMTISMANSEFENLSGYSKGDIEGKMKWTRFVTEEYLTQMKDYHLKRRQGEREIPSEYEFCFVNRSGEVRRVFCRIGMIPGTDKSVSSIMDITRAKELERLLLIQEKMSSLGRVASGLAHEIRNPLSGINIYLNILNSRLQESGSQGEDADIIGRIQDASNKIADVVRRVMDFSKPSEMQLLREDINKPIREALEMSLANLKKGGVRLIKELDQDLPLLCIDPGRIEEVFINLISNAVDAMRGDCNQKTLKISSSVRDSEVLIAVSDSGPGISPQRRNQIFDPFFTTKGDGQGIGLSIVHRIITDHGASISVCTSRWGGAEFRILLPIEGQGTCL
jgi:PAS domain S-box-containing protein